MGGRNISFFLGQHTNPKRNAERRLTKELGRRQAIKTRKALRRGMTTLKGLMRTAVAQDWRVDRA